MYTEIGSFDAKAKLSELLRAVQHGERYTITLRGRPIADLVPSGSAHDQDDVHAAVEALLHLPKIRGVSSDTVSALITEGRC